MLKKKKKKKIYSSSSNLEYGGGGGTPMENKCLYYPLERSFCYKNLNPYISALRFPPPPYIFARNSHASLCIFAESRYNTWRLSNASFSF